MDYYWSEELFEASKKSSEQLNACGHSIIQSQYSQLTEYVRMLGRQDLIGKTFWESPWVANKVEAQVKTDALSIPINMCSFDLIDVPKEFDDWAREDLDNYSKVMRIYKYDPFKDEPLEDKKRLYYNLALMVDEAVEDDITKANAAVDVCRSMQRLEKFNSLRIKLENEPHPDIKELKEVVSMQKAERDAINKLGKEHGFIAKYAAGKVAGAGTLTGILRDMDLSFFEDSLINRYDIATSEAMQQAADISWQAIFRQLNLSETEYTDIIKEQRELINKLQKQNADMKEEIRQFNIEKKRQELQAKIDADIQLKKSQQDSNEFGGFTWQ